MAVEAGPAKDLLSTPKQNGRLFDTAAALGMPHPEYRRADEQTYWYVHAQGTCRGAGPAPLRPNRLVARHTFWVCSEFKNTSFALNRTGELTFYF